MKREKQKWIKIIENFKPHKDYDVTDYYGVSMIKTKRDNKYRLKLIHDYTSNAVLSVSQIELNSLNEAWEFYRILDKFAKNKGDVDRLSISMLDDIEDEDNFEAEDELESTNLQAKTVSHAIAIWEHYKPWLLTNGARVAYLCSPHPDIHAHSEAHKDPLNNIAVEEFIRRVILPRKQIISGDPNVVLAKLVDKFWAEKDNFVKHHGFFSRESIWITAGDPIIVSYEWHKCYLVPAIEVLGLSACLSCSLVLGCEQAEQPPGELAVHPGGILPRAEASAGP
jgi:hypothetical protein